MPSFTFTSPLAPGKCATPIALDTIEGELTFQIDGSTHLKGQGRVNLICDADWFYSDTYGSGRKMLIAANQNLVLPFYDNLVIGVATVSSTGTLYSMILEAEKVH